MLTKTSTVLWLSILLSLDIVVIYESSDRTNRPLQRDSTSLSQNMYLGCGKIRDRDDLAMSRQRLASLCLCIEEQYL
jgi:hypothetical protein